MENNDHRATWRFIDGSVSVSVSMLLSVLVEGCTLCGRLPVLSLLKNLTEREDGTIIVATLMLFPATATLYGGFTVFFAAKEAVEKRAKEKGRQEGRQAERERINKVLAESGVTLTPEIIRKLAGDDQ